MSQQGLRGGAVARYRYLFLLATACGAGVLLFSLHSGSDFLFLARKPFAPSWDHRPHLLNAGHSGTSGTIDTEGCTISVLNPFAHVIKRLIYKPIEHRSCNPKFTFLLNNVTHIWIRKEYLSYNICCCYKSFHRPLSIDNIDDPYLDDTVEYKSCIYFSNYIEVTNEFVSVSCNHENKTHEQFFIFAPKKVMMKRSLFEETPPQNKTWYNVIIMGLDGISRLNFHRTMPKTVAYLSMKGAVEFMGYNKVGDNTLPNLSAALFGLQQEELQTSCWPHTGATFDNCPFIWDRYKNVGYYTALAEDSATLGTFNYEGAGFIDAPTDYYTRTFISEAEKKVGNYYDENCCLCMGNKYFYQVLLDYILDISASLKSSKLFGFFWEVSMSHDFLNKPMLMDDGYEEFLKKLDSSQYLDNTILIFMSDHGIRWGEIRYTMQGRLEERLPLLHILVPPSFRKKYSKAYDNLRLNSRRLTTPFDVHAMLVDLADLDSITDKRIHQRTETAYSHGRSISLFLPVPGNRTCEVAYIDDHWCTCHKSYETATDSKETRAAAAKMIRHLNSLLREHPECARLKLDSVLEARELVTGTPNKMELGWREYLVVVRAEPGGGVFEATLRRETRHWALAGAVSRLNLYRDQSLCMHHKLLKLYCYCV
ncbi:uncharacterized protein LOC126367045 [Pectinophora gossypiella]|uniref:uncharacterized protein LOC126367045 n=1 Tax=Pectinophora gossypiella TaxID=13191 RepID=UPI00214EB133|nr:uncharacterized protein LOC126367045 [Pectinophora gossypiella]